MPGSHVPIMSPDKIDNVDPDVLVILPWNLKREIKELLRGKLKYKG